MAERSYLDNLARSVVWNSTFGLLGLENPDEQVSEWEAENPKAAFLSEAIPLGGATAKGMSLLAKTPRYGKWAKGLASAEKVAESPFLSRLKSEAALMAPIETGRQLAGYAVQETTDLEGDPLSTRLLTAATDVGLGGVLGGGIGWLGSGGKRIKVPTQLADLSAADSWQQNLRKARKAFAEASEEVKPEIENTIWRLERQIKEESRQNMVSELEGVFESKLKGLNSVFRGTDNIRSRTFSTNRDTGFSSLSELEKTVQGLKDTGVLPSDWLEYSQFPRDVIGRTLKARRAIDQKIKAALPEVGNGWRLGKEKDGLYVLARPIGDEGHWFVTKTDMPAKFIPEQGNLSAVLDKNAWKDPETIYKPTGEAQNVLDRTLRFNNLLDDEVRVVGEERKFWESGVEGAKALGEKLGLGKLAESELLGNVSDFGKRYIYPTVFKFKHSPLARKIYAVAQNTLDNSRKRAQELIYGVPSSEGDSLLSVVAKGIKRDDARAFANRLRKFAKTNESGFDAFLDTIDKGIPYEDALILPERANALGNEGLSLLEQLSNIHDSMVKEISDSAIALNISDNKLFPLRKGHYGLSRYWNGSLRQGILNENGNLVYIIGGDNRKGIKKMAEGVISEAKKDGRDWRLGEYWTKDRNLDLRQEKLLAPDEFSLANEFAARYGDAHPDVRQTSFFLPRNNVGGYNRAKTAEEFLENLSYAYENKYIWLAREINDRVLAKDIATLGIDSPKTAVMLQDTLDALNGKQGVFSQLVNKTTDAILSPVLGTDSASKIVRNLNKASASLDLGFGNLAYALANILQPITTVLPQLSLLRECPQAVSWAYDGIPLVGKSGKGMQAHVLSPMKIMWESMKLMGNPKLEEGFSEFMDQMIRDGVLSPRFIESYIGENSGLGRGLAESIKAGDFSGMLGNMASMLPTFSEQASRGYAMTVGYKYFNSLAKAGFLTKEQVYSAAKKFTDNTMFQFATSDRAKILQGPVGGAWGLFKNWTMHYVGWQMQYLDAGLRHGAWKPYMYSNLATSLLGGMGSSEIGATMERFTEWATGDKMSNLLYDRWGDTATSGFLLYGIPGAFGYSLQSQVNSPFRDPGEETQRFMGFVYSNRLKALWNSAASAIDYYSTTGKNPAGDIAFQNNIMRAFAPKMLYRTTQVVNDTLYSGTTRTKIADLTPAQAFMYQYFNIPAARIEQAYKISSEIWKDKDKRNALTSKYSGVMADALEAGDGTQMFRIIQRALVDGVDVSSVMNGANKKLENRNLTPIQRNTDYYGMYGITVGELGL